MTVLEGEYVFFVEKDDERVLVIVLDPDAVPDWGLEPRGELEDVLDALVVALSEGLVEAVFVIAPDLEPDAECVLVLDCAGDPVDVPDTVGDLVRDCPPVAPAESEGVADPLRDAAGLREPVDVCVGPFDTELVGEPEPERLVDLVAESVLAPVATAELVLEPVDVLELLLETVEERESVPVFVLVVERVDDRVPVPVRLELVVTVEDLVPPDDRVGVAVADCVRDGREDRELVTVEEDVFDVEDVADTDLESVEVFVDVELPVTDRLSVEVFDIVPEELDVFVVVDVLEG